MKTDPLLETIAVYNALGARYADQVAHVKLPQLAEFIDMLPHGARVLDVGCAAGRDSAILRDAGFDVVGVDLSENLLELARKRVIGVDFQLMDARELNMKPNTFDGVWVHAMLLNLDRSEIPSVFQGIWKTMKPRATLLVGVKEGEGEKFIGEALVENMKRRETYFGQSEMEDLLRSSRFEITKSYVSGDVLGRSMTKWLYVFATK